MTLRQALSWKTWFYDGLVPATRWLGPDRGDALLGGLGRAVSAAWPGRRARLRAALRWGSEALGAGWDVPAVLPAFEANVPRFQARDCPLDGLADDAFFARFDVTGEEHLSEALARGRGVILVGSHLGGHLSAPHWLYRRGVPLRMLIQRPGHVSGLLARHFAIENGPHPQPGFFLRRDLSAEEASKRVFRTRAALRDGYVVYLKGDVPWVGPNTRPGRLLGYDRSFQSLWAEFAAVFRAPVVTVFCTHLPRARYALTFGKVETVERSREGEAVAGYLARLEDAIRAHPGDAVGHLLWPCYTTPPDTQGGSGGSRRGHRAGRARAERLTA